MRHAFYALFPGRAKAMAALRDLSRLRVQTIVHDGKLQTDKLDLAETDLMPRLIAGVLIGMLVGPLVGLGILSAAGLDVNAPALMLSAMLGAASCGLGGLLIGSGSPDHTLEKLSHEAESHEILVTIVTGSYGDVDAAEDIIHHHGGILVHRGLVSRRQAEPHDDHLHIVAERQEAVWEDEGGNVPDVPNPRRDAPR